MKALHIKNPWDATKDIKEKFQLTKFNIYQKPGKTEKEMN